jgi:hypothetical protein
MASQERRRRAPVYNCPACNTQIIKLKGLVKHMTTCCADTMDVSGWQQVSSRQCIACMFARFAACDVTCVAITCIPVMLLLTTSLGAGPLAMPDQLTRAAAEGVQPSKPCALHTRLLLTLCGPPAGLAGAAAGGGGGAGQGARAIQPEAQPGRGVRAHGVSHTQGGSAAAESAGGGPLKAEAVQHSGRTYHRSSAAARPLLPLVTPLGITC